MKRCTDINQSRKLAKILRLESADMCYLNDGTAIKVDATSYNATVTLWSEWYTDIIPCWSLAALLNYLLEIDFFPEIDADELEVTMSVDYYNEDEARPLAPVHNIMIKAENFIDACYELILKLNELKIL